MSDRRPIAASNGVENGQVVPMYGVVLRNGMFTALKAVTAGGRPRMTQDRRLPEYTT
jgi:hypothetical protein